MRIRLWRLGETTRRTLGTIALEMFIVVAGVFIALWVQQWGNDRIALRQAKEAADRMDEELLRNTASAYDRLAIAHCIDARLKDIIESRKPMAVGMA